MPPWTLPDMMTQSGIKTNSSKKGGGYNEMMFEDKKGEELVRFQAEKNYEQIVKNNAVITIGADKKDPGDMTLEVRNDLTETVTHGNHAFTVATGEQTIAIKQDKTETVEGNCTTTVTKNVTLNVKQGNVTETVDMGNFKLKTSLGKVEIEAMHEILLKVGASSVRIDQMGVTIKGGMIKIEGMGSLEAKAPMTQVNGDALLILKGGLTMIN
jgi:type VI secretion system secreted protein VgrG